MSATASFDWAGVRSRFGSAANVPALLAEAAAADDVEDAGDLVGEAVAHVVDGRWLEPAAPRLVGELFAATRRARHVAPLLHGVLRLLEPEALEAGDPRVVPSDGFLGFTGSWEGGDEAAHRAAQAELRAALRAAAAAEPDALRRAWTSGDDRAAAAAIVLASRLEGRLPSEAMDRATRFSAPASQVAAIAAMHWLEPNLPEPGSKLSGAGAAAPGRAAGPELPRFGPEAQALAGLLRGGAPPDVSEPVVRSCLRPPRRRERWLALADAYDVVWSTGLAGLFAAAIATAPGPGADELLRAVVSDAEAEDLSVPADHAPSRSPAGRAAYWLLRRALPGAWMSGEVLGPEDVPPAAAATLRLLAGCAAWQRVEGPIVQEFGIRDLRRDAARLIGEVRDILSPVHRGTFGGTPVTWSRWKWLMNAVAQSRRQPAHAREAAAQATMEALLLACPDTERAALRAAMEAVLAQARKDVG